MARREHLWTNKKSKAKDKNSKIKTFTNHIIKKKENTMQTKQKYSDTLRPLGITLGKTTKNEVLARLKKENVKPSLNGPLGGYLDKIDHTSSVLSMWKPQFLDLSIEAVNFSFYRDKLKRIILILKGIIEPEDEFFSIYKQMKNRGYGKPLLVKTDDKEEWNVFWEFHDLYVNLNVDRIFSCLWITYYDRKLNRILELEKERKLDKFYAFCDDRLINGNVSSDKIHH